MTRTRTEVVAMAHRRLGVLADDTPMTAGQAQFGLDILDGLIAELYAEHGIVLTFGADVPDALFLPLAYLLAVEMAPSFEIAPRDSRSILIARLRAQEFPDDRPDRRDMDDDGTVTDDDIDADARAVYY